MSDPTPPPGDAQHDWPDYSQSVPAPESERFFAGAYRRIYIALAVLAVMGTAVILLRWGSVAGLGFAAGAAVSFVNLMWLKRIAVGVAERAADHAATESSGRLVLRLGGRYVLLALFAYVIFSGSARALAGFCAGLLLPVAACMLEGAYEVYAVLRRGY